MLNKDSEDSLWFYFLKVFKNYAVFNGRARRKEFFVAFFSSFFFIHLLTALNSFLNDPLSKTNEILGIYLIATFIPYTAVSVRRLHDTNRSGWWLFVPFMNIIFFSAEGQEGTNRFGPNPRPNRRPNTLSINGIFDGAIGGIIDLIIKIISKKYIILVFGILGLLMGFFMDTSVSSGIGRVNNIGLMQEQQNILFISGIAVLIGFYLAKVKK